MEKCLFVYNPEAGKGKIKNKEEYIVKRLSEKYQVEVAHSQYAGNIKEIIIERGEDFSLIVGAGGDGTLNEIIDAVMNLTKKPVLGYIPAGTVNDVAHSLYIPRKLKKAVDNILNGQPFSHDILKINDKFGIYVCAAGLFTEASYLTQQHMKKKIGKVAYMFIGGLSIFRARPMKLKLTFESGEIEGRYAIILINNSRYTAGLRINKTAVLNDGLVDVMIVESRKKIIGIFAILKTMFMFVRGIDHYLTRRHVHHLQLTNFKVEVSENTTINLDGEKSSSGSFSVSVIKSGVQILVPKIHKLQKQVMKIDG